MLGCACGIRFLCCPVRLPTVPLLTTSSAGRTCPPTPQPAVLSALPSPAGGYPAAAPAPAPAPAPSPKAARTLADAHLRCCLYAGVKLSGADVAGEGVHSYRVGPSPGVDLGDDLWTSRSVGTLGTKRDQGTEFILAFSSLSFPLLAV